MEDGPIAGRIKAHIERLERNRLELFAAENASRKRGLVQEPVDGLDTVKRRRLGAELPKTDEPPPLPPGPNSYAQLYTLTDDAALASFGVWQIPQDLVKRAALAMLAHIDAQSLDRAINHVRARYLALSKEANQAVKSSQTSAEEDEEEDYEPNYEPSEDREQILNKVDALPDDEITTEVALGPFTFPQPPPLTTKEAEEEGQAMIDRVFGMMVSLDDATTAKRQNPGLNRLAGSNYDRDAWLTIITRLATRAEPDLEFEGPDSQAVIRRNASPSKITTKIRETLWRYIIADFRTRIGMAISWLNEEWYSDRIALQHQSKENTKDASSESTQTPNYDKWTLRVLDGIMPYLDAKDKLLLRFLSEIPVVNEDILLRVKSLAKDPERVDLAVRALHYLILMKPPCREICIDAIEDLWRNYDDAKVATTKILTKWRPYVLPPPAKNPPAATQKTTAPQAPAQSKESPGPGTPVQDSGDGPQSKGSHPGLPLAAAG